MLNVIICDDNPTHLAYTTQQTELFFGSEPVNIKSYTEPERMFAELERAEQPPDIAVMDIRLGDTADGIETAKRLHELSPTCEIIFLTSYIEYAPDVYEVDHVYFVLKEQMPQRLPEALERAVERLRRDDRRLVFREGQELCRLRVGDIYYIERQLHKTRIVAVGGEFHPTKKPQELLDENGCAAAFIRCHQSFWINPNAVIRMRSSSFDMCSGENIPIARSRLSDTREEFFAGVLKNKK